MMTVKTYPPSKNRRDIGEVILPIEKIKRARELSSCCVGVGAILAGFVLALPLSMAHTSERTTMIGYICNTYESARQVALEQGWERPESMPDDCLMLLGRVFDERVAEILEIIDVLPVGDDRWIEIGRVRRKMVETGYSAGISEQLLLF